MISVGLCIYISIWTKEGCLASFLIKMFDCKLVEGACLKKLIESMKDLFSDVNFDATESGMSCQAIDSSHVCLCSVLLRKELFQDYRCDRNICMGMNTGTLSKILKCAGNDETIVIQAQEDHLDCVTFIFEKQNQERVSKFEMKLMDIDSEHLGIPDQEYDVIIKMPSAELQRICRDLSQFGDTVTITCTKNGISFKCNGENGNGEITLLQSSAIDGNEKTEVSFELKEPVSQTYAMRFLIFFTKATCLSDRVQLSICKNLPLVTEYKIGDEGYIRYYLAPKIDDDEEEGDENMDGQQEQNGAEDDDE